MSRSYLLLHTYGNFPMLNSVGIVISLFLCTLLAGKKNKNEGDHILAVWLLLIGTHLTFYSFFLTKFYLKFPYYLGLELPLPFVHPPLLYLYTASLTHKLPKKIYVALHFLPIIVTYILFYSFLTLPIQEKILVYQHEGVGYEWSQSTMNTAIVLSGLIYILWTLALLRQHEKSIKTEYADTEKINLNWLRYLIYGLSVIWIAVMVGEDALIFGLVVLFVLFMGYFGIHQVGIFASTAPPLPIAVEANPVQEKMEDPGLQDPPHILEPKQVKYEKSGLQTDQAFSIHAQLKDLMVGEKLFTDPNITLSELAKKLNVHPNTLSQVINSLEEKNFYDYINYHRVAEFRHRLALPQNQQYTLLALAHDCGFNSKTSFNRNFKKVLGMPPREYVKLQNIHIRLN